MGLLGSQAGSAVGGLLGKSLGGKYGGSRGAAAGQEIGKVLGKVGGSFLPFKKGGKVTKKTQKALLHKGEIVVPAKLAKHVSKSLKDKIKANGGHGM